MYLDEVGDGHGDGMDRPLQIRHSVAIFRFFMKDHQPLNLFQNKTKKVGEILATSHRHRRC